MPNPSISDKLKNVNFKKLTGSLAPLWQGPQDGGPQGGITQSLLGRFLSCRERFRILTTQGLKPADTFNHKLEFGNMWHLCEEWYAVREQELANRVGGDAVWLAALKKYARQLCTKYKTEQKQIEKWYYVCSKQFPIYIDYWQKRNQGWGNVESVCQEEVFNIPYRLQSGRIVHLKGKIDSIHLSSEGIWLQDHKTKGQIIEEKLKRQLTFDLQTMFYLVVLSEWKELGDCNTPIRTPELVDADLLGVHYNVIRRPLSGGKGNIVQLKPTKKNPDGESKEHYYSRLAKYITDEPDTYFMRWEIPVTGRDIEIFKKECLNPILENLCCWYDHVVRGQYYTLPEWALNWRHPYGVWNPLNDGGSSELDNYLDTGSELGLERVDNLFPELV